MQELLSRNVAIPLAGTWRLADPLICDFEQRKAGLMYRAVRAKYEQHPQLAAELLATAGPIRAAASTSEWQRDQNGETRQEGQRQCGLLGESSCRRPTNILWERTLRALAW